MPGYHSRPAKIALLLVAGALSGTFVGCGSYDGNFPISNVAGTVTLDDSPLVNAKVTFVPQSGNAESGPFSTGKTDESGKFVLTTRNGYKGAVVGSHAVVIELEGGGPEREIENELDRRRREGLKANHALSPSDEAEIIVAIKNKYKNLKTKFDGLQFSVTAEGTSDANFDLKSN